ncbi:MAG TPA: hypothetical protein VMW91_05545 [Desulfosporosinus sp.]|nr:hypothetical protein [Desulfosporosinus sp.]
MKLGLTFPVESIHGAMSKQPGIVGFEYRGIQCARKWVAPTNPNSLNQSAIRNLLAQCAQAFQEITLENKSSWAAYAALHPRHFLTKPFTIPEISAFVSVNIYRLIAGEAISDTPPTDTCDFLATNIETLGYVSGTTTLSFIVTHTAAVVTNKHWGLYITRSMPSAVRKVRKNDYVLADGVAAGSIIDVTVTPQTIEILTPRFMDWVDDDFMGIKVVPFSPLFDIGTLYEELLQVTVT